MIDKKAPQSLLGMTPGEVEALIKEMGEPGFRAKQVVEWTFARRVADIEAMTNLPKALRERLKERLRRSGAPRRRGSALSG